MIEKNKLGIGLFIISEANFFLMLILVYVYFHSISAVSGPTAASSLEPAKTGINTLFLLASSLTIWLAGKSLKQESHSMLCVWLLVTIVLGAMFLLGQGREWTRLIDQDVTISRDLFGTTFFTLTGFHGFHVLVGLIAIAILFGLAITGDFKSRQSAAVEAVSLYWHFVDVVWIVIFTIVYLRVAL